MNSAINQNQVPLFVTIPHSGEKIPAQADWLKNLPEPILMCDVDRYVDILYCDTLTSLKIPYIKTEWHRYCGDLNRLPEDVDASTVLGHAIPAGKNARGFLWAITTTEIPLMKKPVDPKIHNELVELIYKPFHQEILNKAQELSKQFQEIYQIDAHSMPSKGTNQHRDPGEYRADIVISDSGGKSCSEAFRDLVITSYVTAGFKVGYNWPYFGGRVTEQYGHPEKGHHCIQVELNRGLYMNEENKKLDLDKSKKVSEKVAKALQKIQEGVGKLLTQSK